jgi:hypothetical protein
MEVLIWCASVRKASSFAVEKEYVDAKLVVLECCDVRISAREGVRSVIAPGRNQGNAESIDGGGKPNVNFKSQCYEEVMNACRRFAI